MYSCHCREAPVTTGERRSLGLLGDRARGVEQPRRTGRDLARASSFGHQRLQAGAAVATNLLDGGVRLVEGVALALSGLVQTTGGAIGRTHELARQLLVGQWIAVEVRSVAEDPEGVVAPVDAAAQLEVEVTSRPGGAEVLLLAARGDREAQGS